MADRNYISFTQNEAGIWQRVLDLEPILLFPTGTPRELRVVTFDHELDPRIHGSGSDTIKVSGVDGLTLKFNAPVHGWGEDVIDINNRSRDIVAEFARAQVHGRYFATLKGESRNLYISVQELAGVAREVMFDLGNRSEQAKGRTTDVFLAVESAVIQPVSVRVMHAWRPHLTGGVQWKVDTRLMGWVARLFWLFPYLFRK